MTKRLGPLHVRRDEEPDVEYISVGYDMTRDLCTGCGGRHKRDDCTNVPMGLYKGPMLQTAR